MNQRTRINSRGLGIVVSWSELNGRLATEDEFIQTLRRLPVTDTLYVLLRILRFGDSGSNSKFGALDQAVADVIPIPRAGRVANILNSRPNRLFFTRWQLLATIKLVCVFGHDEESETFDQSSFLDALLMTNDFVHRDSGESPPRDTNEATFDSLVSQALKTMSLLHYEPAIMTVGRYSELLHTLPSAPQTNHHRTPVDLNSVLGETLGFELADLESVLFSAYASVPTKFERRLSGKVDLFPTIEDENAQVLPFCFNPTEWLASTALEPQMLSRVLDYVSCTPSEIRQEHQTQFGATIGRMFDLGALIRRPILKLSDSCSAVLSHNLMVQRFTLGAYWDIHDALENGTEHPNRTEFQNYFGELHESYGMATVGRISDYMRRMGKQVMWIPATEYATENEKNADGLLIEQIGASNTRCTMFEFTVGRPRYGASIVPGDSKAFAEDLEKQLGSALSQEIDLCTRLIAGQRKIDGLSAGSVHEWFFVVVVTDPFPTFEFVVRALHSKLDSLPQISHVKYYGPFILSLYELELLEGMKPKRISDLLRDWANGPDRILPFQTFYSSRMRGRTANNAFVEERGRAAIDRATARAFPGDWGSER